MYSATVPTMNEARNTFQPGCAPHVVERQREQHAAHAVGNTERAVYERLPALNVAVAEVAPKGFDRESDHAAYREDPYQL